MLLKSLSFRAPGIYLGAEMVSVIRSKDGWVIEEDGDAWVFATPPWDGDESYRIPREQISAATVERRKHKGKVRAA